MRRQSIEPRADWEEKVKKHGLLYYANDDGPYWNESAFYELTSADVEALEAATNTLHEMCLNAVQHVIDANRFEDLRINPAAIPWIKWSWEAEPPAIYGRFDLAYNGFDPPKLIEYNADTPTALLESAVVQWYWLEEVFPGWDQFNSIWEGLVAKWKLLKDGGYLPDGLVHFTCADSVEDYMTITAMRDTAAQAGVKTEALLVDEIGWDGAQFVDLRNRPMRTIFKLYPWEWLVGEEFGGHLLATYDRTQWMEPIWKMVLSNKGILPILWELYPEHPNLLPAFFDSPRDLAEFAEKPLLGREGANVRVSTREGEFVNGGDYGGQRCVYQKFVALPEFDGVRTLIGSWVIDDAAHGIGIREATVPITTNLSPFVPHRFR
jgi:glutathionylspermidine synthase